MWDLCPVVSHSPNQGISDEFVYEGYPDRQQPQAQVEVEPHPQYAEEEEQVIGAEDYELEETESEISGTDQVRTNSMV